MQTMPLEAGVPLADRAPVARRAHWVAVFQPLILSSQLTRHGVELAVPSARRADVRTLVERFVAVERRGCEPLCYAVSPDLGDGTFHVLIVGPADAAHSLRWLLGLEAADAVAPAAHKSARRARHG